MIRQSRNSMMSHQRGLAMVEFAILLPVIVMLILAVAEVGRAIIQYNTLTKSLRDGVRHAAAYGLLGTTGSVLIDADLANEIRNLVVYGNTNGGTAPLVEGLTPGQVDISVPEPGLIRVGAVHPYAPFISATLPTFGRGTSPSLVFDLRAAVTMRAL